MARIAFMEDVAVPTGVAVANLALHHWDAERLEENPDATLFEPIVGIIGIGAGYAMQAFDVQPVIGNRIAVASMVPGIRGVYDWIRAATTEGATTKRTSLVPRKRIGIRTSANPGNQLEDPLTRYRQGGI